MLYQLASRETVRVRTCNDHLLVVLADREAEDAKLNIEGTDFLLVVMPETPREFGPVMAYLVPTPVAVEAARTTHREWLASRPNTKGDNRTWNLWFDDAGPAKANGFAKKWGRYRLPGTASTSPQPQAQPAGVAATKLGEVIAAARRQIADAAGVPPEAVRISVDLG